MKKRIRINDEVCNGCRICTMACSVHKSQKFNPFLTGIWIDSDDGKGSNTPLLCRQCLNPVCVKACPAEQVWNGSKPYDPPIFRDPDTGVIGLDSAKETCIGCMECMHACPFGSIRIVPEDLSLVKCDLCDGDPECVKFCPTGAVQFLEITRSKTPKVKKNKGSKKG